MTPRFCVESSATHASKIAAWCGRPRLLVAWRGAFLFCGSAAFAAPLEIEHALPRVLAESPVGALAPHEEARTYAMASLAMERAIATVHDASRPIGADEAIGQAAAAVATQEVWRGISPVAQERMDRIVATHLAAVGPAADRARAREAGKAAATQVLEARAGDRWCDPVGGLAKADARWRAAIPFAIEQPGKFEVRLPYWRDIDGQPQPDPLITRARIFDQIDRTASAATLVRFWSGSAIARWNDIAQELVGRSSLDLPARARFLALVNVAMADATLVTLHAQAVLGDWQRGWTERWTPTDDPMPDDLVLQVPGTGQPTAFRRETRAMLGAPLRRYPALAATIGSAARVVLLTLPEAERGPLALAGPGGLARTFARLDDAARECAYAASLSGEDSREASVAGYHLGEAVGRQVLKQMPAVLPRTNTPRPSGTPL